MENIDIVTGRTIAFADAFCKAFFNDTYTNMLQKLEGIEAKIIKLEKEAQEINLRTEKIKLETKKIFSTVHF